MNPGLQKGKLATWKDDQGFGFIKPEDGGRDVFLHISALKGAGRRPRVGDTILYQQVTESARKIRAARASIQGVAPRPLPVKRKSSKGGLLGMAVGIAVLAVVTVFTMQFAPSRSPSLITSILRPECTIKGNIAVATGNKVYHLPGMEDYESTVIDHTKGERWFCSESDAIAQGWRKAPR
ncbi:cold shock domain-containing protein [Leptothoe sp. PORK10 BA2]|uniref:cold shock domain-containing protein n=1 Tax=Leptothoe sp. PORK10 BA2 TaxID=3110254 RepID=UPI002B1E9936|nr:cold shock domain-containing protein [Leptothoe sp. PORK10 BA2]MEA5465785.1 cold shock domain-containing protein [Leptothoe sp. PORK10 BA2]